MSSDIPGWVRSYCKRWGSQKRRILSGKDWLGNVDGYANSLIGRIREERDGAAQGEVKQYWPEIYWGPGIEVQRAIVGMPERQLYAVHFQHVFDPEWGLTIARKASYLSIGRTEYTELVDRAETWIYSRLDALGRPDSQLTERVHEIIKEALQTAQPKAIKAHSRQNCPPNKLDFSALKRPIISLRLTDPEEAA